MYANTPLSLKDWEMGVSVCSFSLILGEDGQLRTFFPSTVLWELTA